MSDINSVESLPPGPDQRLDEAARAEEQQRREQARRAEEEQRNEEAQRAEEERRSREAERNRREEIESQESVRYDSRGRRIDFFA